VQLARKIDSAQHKIKKDNHERNWMKEAAEAMEIESDQGRCGHCGGSGVRAFQLRAAG